MQGEVTLQEFLSDGTLEFQFSMVSASVMKLVYPDPNPSQAESLRYQRDLHEFENPILSLAVCCNLYTFHMAGMKEVQFRMVLRDKVRIFSICRNCGERRAPVSAKILGSTQACADVGLRITSAAGVITWRRRDLHVTEGHCNLSEDEL